MSLPLVETSSSGHCSGYVRAGEGSTCMCTSMCVHGNLLKEISGNEMKTGDYT